MGAARPCLPAGPPHVLTRASVEASLNAAERAPTADVLEHHLAIVFIVALKIDDRRVASHPSATDLLKVDVELPRPGSRDLVEAVRDAVEAAGFPGTAVADHDDGGALVAWGAGSALVIERRQEVARTALFALAVTGPRSSDRAMRAAAQVRRQHTIGLTAYWPVCKPACGADECLVAAGPHRQCGSLSLPTTVGSRVASAPTKHQSRCNQYGSGRHCG